MAKIRLMIVDAHEVVRLGMRAVFELEPDIAVVGEASNGEEAFVKVGVLDPQVILMDIRMEKMGGIEACREIKSHYPAVYILMITTYTDDDAVYASIFAEASGYLLKNVGRAELLRAIRLAASGQSLLDPEMTKQATTHLTTIARGGVPPQEPGDDLTDHEREVLALVTRGYTNRQIADTLFVSEKTARNHISHILEKLGLSRRSEAAAFAVEHKLVPLRRTDANDAPPPRHTPRGPIYGTMHSPRPRTPRTYGIPAIRPRSLSSSPDIPSFTADDVRAYIPTASEPRLKPVPGASLTIEKILFISNKEATELMLGSDPGLPDDALVCVALLKGPFYVQVGYAPGRQGNPAATASKIGIVFDAHTGNLLEWAVLG